MAGDLLRDAELDPARVQAQPQRDLTGAQGLDRRVVFRLAGRRELRHHRRELAVDR